MQMSKDKPMALPWYDFGWYAVGRFAGVLTSTVGLDFDADGSDWSESDPWNR